MYTLPKLPYGYDELEPYIDAQTMELHHTKHHQTYIDKLNTALEGTEWADKSSLDELLQNVDSLPEDKQTAVRNNGGGHFNHTFFWESMTPEKNDGPNGQLLDVINATYGTFDTFKEQFAAAAASRFGSGWVWATLNGETLEISSTPNQDSPIMSGVMPLLGLDVWEHAYYLKYQNRRPEYVDNWWNVVNWQAVSARI